MDMKKIVLLITMVLCVMQAGAQTDEQNWLLNQRPEHWEEPSTEAHTDSPLRAMRRIGSQATAPIKSRGTQHVPVVLVSFADVDFTVADNDEDVNAYYQRFCNGTMDGVRYTGHGSYGSIRDYFIEQSDSVFFPLFSVIGPVRLDSAFAYYGRNSGSSKDIRFSTFRDHAIAKAVQQHSDWASFDNDGNGSIDMVFFIFAGVGENTSKNGDHIWPKESTASVTMNGRVFATSAATSELRAQKVEDGVVTKSQPDGVGVFIHELSHALGLPDFYDTNYVGFGMDLWSVMDYGEYANNGFTPTGYTAYERDFMGWRPLQTLDEPCILTIASFTDGGYGYKIVNEANPDEYYVIENRQPKSWDRSACNICRGLQVTHVDFNRGAWNGNSVNTDPKHQRMTIIAANNNYTGANVTTDFNVWRATMAGQLYPGDTYNYDLTDESTPAAEVFTGVLMHKPIRNITQNEDGTLTLCYRTFGQLNTPELHEFAGVENQVFDISWNPVDNATRYALELYRDEILEFSDTLTDTSCRFEHMPPSANMSARVRAMADSPEDYLESPWSSVMHFDTLDDGVANLTDGEGIVEVFAANGMCVGHCRLSEVGRLRLQRGIYIVRTGDGQTRKVAFGLR